jgi:hypothetical protein
MMWRKITIAEASVKCRKESVPVRDTACNQASRAHQTADVGKKLQWVSLVFKNFEARHQVKRPAASTGLDRKRFECGNRACPGATPFIRNVNALGIQINAGYGYSRRLQSFQDSAVATADIQSGFHIPRQLIKQWLSPARKRAFTRVVIFVRFEAVIGVNG